MKIFKTISELQTEIQEQRKAGKRLGFVPTMGALHEGHLSLLLEAQQENDLVIASIYVNPTQFNDPSDLEKYPRPIEKDIKALESLSCDYLFLPTTAEIYPENLRSPDLDLEGLDRYMEGAHRPGHFAGVVQVVHRLLDLVQPDSLYMGQKDFQQFSIIAHLIKTLEMPVELVRVAIVREADGLAMSSRNVHLSKEGRQLAPVLHKTLQDLKYHYEQAPNSDPRQLEQKAKESLLKAGIPALDYLDIVDGYSLSPIKNFEEIDFVVACATIRVDGIRLLDNIVIKEEKSAAYQKEQAEKQMLRDRVDALKD